MSLLSYGHDLGYTPFNASDRIKFQSDTRSRGASLAKRIMSPAEVALLIRAAPSKRDRVLIEVAYASRAKPAAQANGIAPSFTMSQIRTARRPTSTSTCL